MRRNGDQGLLWRLDLAALRSRFRTLEDGSRSRPKFVVLLSFLSFACWNKSKSLASRRFLPGLTVWFFLLPGAVFLPDGSLRSRLQHENLTVPNQDRWTPGRRPQGCGSIAMDRRKLCVLVVLWATAFVSSPGHGLRALRRTTGGRRGSTGLTGQDANGVPLRRSKRGWMWNQFFLLEEYMGTDMQYVGKVSSSAYFQTAKVG